MPRADRGPGEFFLLWHLSVRKRPIEEQERELTILKHMLLAMAEMLERQGITVYLVDEAKGQEFHWKEVVEKWACTPQPSQPPPLPADAPPS